MAAEAEPGLLEGLASTRTIRRYERTPIPKDDLSTIVWHATRAPSGSNRQPFRFLVLTDSPTAAAAKALLGRAFRAGWSDKKVADGVLPRPDSSAARHAAAMDHYVANFESTPVVILACLVRYRPETSTEGASIYPACQNLLLAARALGYGGALTMWHLAVEDDLRELLRIPADVALSACITLGRPIGGHGPVRRRPVSELVFEDEWGSSAPWAVDPEGTRHTATRPR